MSGEVRIPVKLLSSSLSEKKIRPLRLLAAAKLHGHRARVRDLRSELNLTPKTASRLVVSLVNDGMAGFDGKYLFPRSWHKMGLSKRKGLYLDTIPHDMKFFECLAFIKVLKRVCRKGSPHPKQGRVLQTDFPTGYLCSALDLRERRFKALKATSQKYKLIAVIPRYRIIGNAKELENLRKNLPGLPVFQRGRKSVVPDVSTVKFLI